LRKLLVAILAVPVLATIYVGAALGRSPLVRAGTAVGLGAIIAFGAIGFARPTVTTATPTSDIVPLTQAAFRTSVGTDVGLDEPATLTFSTPMERASVEAAIQVVPATPIDLRWGADDTSLAIVPAAHWAPDTYYTITVRAGALAGTGRPTTEPVRAAFLTRGATAVTVAATETAGARVAIGTAFTLTFDRDVDEGSLEEGVRLEPAVEGTISLISSLEPAVRYTFTPAAPLRPDTRYRLVVDGVRDAEGLALEPTTLAIRTTAAPAVVRFRPRPTTQDVDRSAAISVRFTRSMDRASTKRAFRVTVNGKSIAGTVRFAEEDTVLVFDPAKALPYDARVVATVAATATSAEGVPLAKATSSAFRTLPKVAPIARATTSSGGGGSGGGGGGGGGSVGSGSWTAVERYYLGLMNCTRTGGLVTSGGDCSSPGGRNVAALKLDSGISSKVARPYAKKLAVNNMCTHFSGGNPGDRLRRAGYTSYRWAENLGCRSGNPYSAVLGSHRYFQSERSWSPPGGHYVNLMNSAYDRVGIGVWVSGGRVRLVVDFYHP
jgi:uncharacterized protein YkwD